MVWFIGYLYYLCITCEKDQKTSCSEILDHVSATCWALDQARHVLLLLLDLLDHLLPGALRADDVLTILCVDVHSVCQRCILHLTDCGQNICICSFLLFKVDLDEALANHGVFAEVAEEALVVPGQRLKGHKLGAPKPTLAWFE